MTPTLPFSLSQRIEALFRERESLSEEQITYQVQELFQAAATSQEHSLITDALQRKTIELGSCPAIEKALGILNGGQKRALEEGISSNKKRQAIDPSVSSSSEDFSIIQQVWQWAEQTRNSSPLLAHPSKENFSSAPIPVITADGEGTLSSYHLFLLAVHSEFVFSTLKFNINQQREEQSIKFEDFSLSIIQKIACALEEELIALPQEEESLAILESAQFLQLDKCALEKLLPLYTPFFQDKKKSLQEFSACLDHFQGLEIDLPLLADEVLAEKLSRMNAQQILDEETLFQGVQFLVSCYRKYPDSQVHEKLRSLFSHLILKEINLNIFGKNSLLQQLAPPIELTITLRNIYLLKHPFVKKHLTHCTIAVGYKEFYLEVLDILQKSFDKVMKRLSLRDRLFLSKLPEKYRNDPAIMLVAVKQDGYNLQYASEELRGSEEIVLAAVKQNGRALQYASEELRGHREIVLTAVTQSGYSLQYASEELRGSEEIVLAAVKQNGRAFQYASEELRGHREIVLIVVTQSGYAFRYASEELRGSEEIILAAIEQDIELLKYASEAALNDWNIVLAAVKRNGDALVYASEELAGNKEIVLAAVKQKGHALGYASEELRGSKEVVLAAVEENSYAFQYASEELRGHREIVLTAVTQSGYDLRYASEELRNDREIVLAAVKQDGSALRHASEELRGNEEIVLAAVKQNGCALQYARRAERK